MIVPSFFLLLLVASGLQADPALQHHVHSLEQQLRSTHARIEEQDHDIEAAHRRVDRYEEELHLLREEMRAEFAKLHSQLAQQQKSEEALKRDLSHQRRAMEGLLSELEEEGSGEVYVVREGDVLGKIAKKFHTSVSRLREINQLKGDRIFKGQKLQVPRPASS